MKHNFANSCINFIYKKKFVFSQLMIMRLFLGILCCMMIIPATVYAQSDIDTLQIEHEQYILKRTGDVLVKIFGNLELDKYDLPAVTITHTSPNEKSVTHNVMTNDQGYYEFYFIHDWKSIRGNYDIILLTDATVADTISYELIQDPAYKTDEVAKEEYLMDEENRKTNAASLTKKIPDWVKNIFGWYYLDRITEGEVIGAIQYLVKVDIIKLD